MADLNNDNKSQTDPNPLQDVSGDLKNIFDFVTIDNQGKITNYKENLSPSSGFAKKLQKEYPEYQGWNTRRFRFSLINNEDGILDKITDKSFSKYRKRKPSKFEEGTKTSDDYMTLRNEFKSRIKNQLLDGTVTGKSIKNTVVDRAYQINKDLKDEGSASFRNNNPLNMMYSSMSDDLKTELLEQGVEFSKSDITNRDGTLAKFPSYEQGMKAAKYTLKNKHGDSTVSEALAKWSNKGYDTSILPEDKDWGDKKISELSSSQLDILTKKMQEREGWLKPGDNSLEPSYPIEEYKDYIRQDPKKYAKFGVVNSDGQISLQTKDENRSLEGLIKNDEEFHKTLLDDRYSAFEKVMDNEYNQVQDLTKQPSVKSAAFSVYDKYGSEGLTNFMNILQHQYLDDPSLSETEIRKSLSWYRKNNVGRDIKKFNGRGKNQIEFTPPKSTMDTEVSIPKDANGFTLKAFYEFDKENNKFKEKSFDETLDYFIDEFGLAEAHGVTKKEQEYEDKNPYLTGLKKTLKAGIESTPIGWAQSEAISFASSLFDDEETEVEELSEESLQELRENLKNTEESSFTEESPYDFLTTAIQNKLESKGTLGNLLKAFQANAQHAGDNKWILNNYDEQPFKNKVIVDAMNKNTKLGSMIMPDGDGNIILNLDRPTEIKETSDDLLSWFVDEETTPKMTTTEGGRITYERVTKPEVGPLASTWNSVVTAGVGLTKGAGQFFIEPSVRGLRKASELAEEATGSETAGDMADYLEWFNESDGMEAVANGTPASLAVEQGDMLTKTTSYVMPFVNYVGSTMLMSRGALAGASGINNMVGKVRSYSKANKLFNAVNSSKFLGVNKASKFGTMLDKWNKATKARESWAYMGNFYLGDTILESTQPEKYSMANYGAQGIDAAVEYFSNNESNLEEKYRAADGLTKMGVDALSSFALSSVVDNLLASGRFWADSRRIKNGQKIQTNYYDPLKGKFDEVESDKPFWRNELNEFFHNLTSDLDRHAIGNHTETMMNGITKRGIIQNPENIESVNDFTELFFRDSGDLLNDDIYNNIEDAVRHYVRNFDGDLDESRISDIAEGQYNRLIENVSDGVYNMFSRANVDNPDSLPLKFANSLDDASVRHKGVNSMRSEALSLDRANELAGQKPNRYVVEGSQEGQHYVFEVSTNLWASDLANAIRKKSKSKSLDDTINQELRSKGLRGEDLNEEQVREADEINQHWNDVYGQRVFIDEQGEQVGGYVVGRGSSNGYKVLTDAGDELDNVGLRNSAISDEMDANTLSRMETRSEGTDRVAEVDYKAQRSVQEAQSAIKMAQDNLDREFIDNLPQKIRDAGDLLQRSINKKQLKRETFSPKLYDDDFRNQWGLGQALTGTFKQFRETGRKSYKMVENVIRNFGVDDDDVRNLVRVTKGGNEKRIVGKKNKTDIKEWDGSKGDVPKDVLVKRTNRKGQVEYFLSNQKTALEPSRWLETADGIRLNPDWDKVNVNQTIRDDGTPQTFVEEIVDGKRMYREPEEGETGEVFLNLQNPLRASESTKELSNKEIVETGVDGFIRNRSGKTYIEPVSPEDQVKSGRDIVNYENREAVDIKELPKTPEKEEILADVEQAGFKGVLAGPFVGYVVGGIADEIAGMDNEELATFGAAAGLLLGSATVRSKMKGLMYNSGKHGDDYDKAVNGLREKEKIYKKNRESKEVFGSTFDYDSEELSKWEKYFVQPYKAAIEAGKSGSEFVRSSRYFQSSFSFLDKLGFSEQANRLKNVLMGLDREADKLKRQLTLNYNKAVGDDNAYADLRDDAIQFTKDWMDRNNMSYEDLSDQQVWDRFNRARSRIMHGNARIDQGQFKRNSGDNFQHVDQYYRKEYDSNNLNTAEQFDRELLQHEKLGKFFDVQRQWYKDIKDEWIGTLRNEMDHYSFRVYEENKRLTRKLRGHNGDLSDFRSKLDEDELKTFNKAKRNDYNFKRMLELKSRMNKFQDLGDAYEPMMMSKRKLKEARDAFYDQKGVRELDSVEKERQFREKLLNDFTEINGEKGKLIEYKNMENDIGEKTFSSISDARNQLTKIINSPRTGLTKDQQNTLLGLDDEFISEKEIIETNENGEAVARTQYVLEEPESLREEINLFERYNKNSHDEFMDHLMSGSFVRNSNHLEKPRKYVLPEYLAETDLDNLMQHYTRDVGKRLHLVKNGIIDEQAFEHRYIKNIEQDLRQKGLDQVADDHLNRIRSIYRLQAGINHDLSKYRNAGERAKAAQQLSKKAKTFQTLRNFIGSAYNHMIAYYDIFQHAIMTPLLTSWGSWRKSVWAMGKDASAVQRMNKLGEDLHYAEQQLNTYMPEIGKLNDDVTWNNNWHEWFYDVSNKAIDFSSRFSVSKGIGKATGMWDPDQAGLSKLLFDDFYGVNQTATSINALAHLAEAQKLAKVARQFEQLGEGVSKGTLEVDGNVYRYSDVKRNIQQLGVNEEDYLDFINKTDEINRVVDWANGQGRNTTISDLDQTSGGFKYMENILQSATDRYHGRNKMFRPEGWLTPVGRLVSQYSIYPFNFALQTTQRKIRLPIAKWEQEYGDMFEDQDVPFMKVVYNMNRGQTGVKKLKDMGLSQEAIDSIPTEAFKTTAKMLPAMGISFGMMASRDAVQDLLAMATGVQEPGDFEKFDKNFVFNPYAPKAERESWEDLDFDVETMSKFAGYMAGKSLDMGWAGVAGQRVINDAKFGNSGVLEMTPVGQFLGDAVNLYKETAGTAMTEGLDDVPRTAGKELYETVMGRLPILGSQSQFRNKTSELMFNKSNAPTVINSQTGEQIATDDLVQIGQ